MLKKIILIALFVLPIVSCNNEKENHPKTALDTGRSFIRASLDGDFNSAEQLLFTDTLNLQLFDSYKMLYNRRPDNKKQHYKTASYVINKYLEDNDSTVIINYSNSYMNKPLEIKVVRINKEWKIDFKYTYSGNLPID